MSISLNLNQNFLAYHHSGLGSRSRLRVGVELAPLSSSHIVTQEKREVSLSKPNDVRFTSTYVMDAARHVTQNGGKVRHFRDIDVEKLTADTDDDDQRQRIGNLNYAEARQDSALYNDGVNKVTYNDGVISIWGSDDSGKFKKLEEHTITDDSRISFDKTGTPVFESGSDARNDKGELASSEGTNDILIRVSDADVLAGNGSTVLNLSKEAGIFSGGSSVTYLGNYHEATIEAGTGENEFAGYFKNSTITGNRGQDNYSGVFETSNISANNAAHTFSGYFFGAEIQGGDTGSTYNGFFVEGTNIQAGDGGNTFNGRFIDSNIRSGAGDDRFGRPVNLRNMDILLGSPDKLATGLNADFIGSDVDAGEGNDDANAVMHGGNLKLGNGNDKVRGVFDNVNVWGGEGDDKLSAMFSYASRFDTGDGNDAVTLTTSMYSSVVTGEGNNQVSMGHNPDDEGEDASKTVGGGVKVDQTLWKEPQDSLSPEMREEAAAKAALQEANEAGEKKEEKEGGPAAMPVLYDFGSLGGNRVEAERGTSSIRVKNGEGEQHIVTGYAEQSQLTEEAKKSPQETLQAFTNENHSRFAVMRGDAPVEAGAAGVSIDAGTKEDLIVKVKKLMEESDGTSLFQDWGDRRTIRATGNGGYRWVRSKS